MVSGECKEDVVDKKENQFFYRFVKPGESLSCAEQEVAVALPDQKGQSNKVQLSKPVEAVAIVQRSETVRLGLGITMPKKGMPINRMRVSLSSTSCL